MNISEPMTLFTDYVVAAVCGYLSVKLLQQAGADRPAKLWGIAFAVIAFASITGGSYHGFAPNLDVFARAVLWKFTVYAIGIFDLIVVAATILAAVPARARPWLLGVAGLKFLVYAAWMTTHNEYVYVILDSAGAMVVLLVFHAYSLVARRDAASRWIVTAVIVSAVAAAVQASGLDLHLHFNHNDLYHVIQIAAMLMFGAGAKQLRSYAEPFLATATNTPARSNAPNLHD
ncbi:MAG: hypothetical protein HY706_03590 [Candidatus Hydrogenedentes bacterium]|nr:hypothetical protein [Candidatus Hydrogenedentota bacterium]